MHLLKQGMSVGRRPLLATCGYHCGLGVFLRLLTSPPSEALKAPRVAGHREDALWGSGVLQ